MKVTLEQLRTAGPCKEGYNRGVRLLQGEPFTEEDAYRTTYLGCDHDQPIPLEEIADRLGLQEALWATRCLEGHDRDLRLYGVWAVREIQHLLKDPRSWRVLDVAEAFANGKATAEELEEARADAYASAAAYVASDAAAPAAYDAAYRAYASAAAYVASDAASAAAYVAAPAAYAAAYDDASAAASAASAYAAYDAALKAAEAKQKAMFIKMCRGEAPWQVNH